jgi:hypothetical protein
VRRRLHRQPVEGRPKRDRSIAYRVPPLPYVPLNSKVYFQHCPTAFNARFWKLLSNAGGLSFLGRLMSPCGPSCHLAALQKGGRYQSTADKLCRRA